MDELEVSPENSRLVYLIYNLFVYIYYINIYIYIIFFKMKEYVGNSRDIYQNRKKHKNKMALETK